MCCKRMITPLVGFSKFFLYLADMFCKQIEKALHEMRAECAEAKVASENKLAEAQSMMEDAQKKYADVEEKLHKAKSLEAEASLYNRSAERKLSEVESREDDLRRQKFLFKSEYVLKVLYFFLDVLLFVVWFDGC